MIENAYTKVIAQQSSPRLEWKNDKKLTANTSDIIDELNRSRSAMQPKPVEQKDKIVTGTLTHDDIKKFN